MAIEDPLRVIGSFVLGSMVTGAIVGAMNIGLSTPGADVYKRQVLLRAKQKKPLQKSVPVRG